MESNFYIYPELSSSGESEKFQILKESNAPTDNSPAFVTIHHEATWVPTGARVTKEKLTSLRDEVISLAVKFGFPDTTTETSSKRKFNRELSSVLHHSMQISPSNAARKEVWSYLSMILLPDVAMWRYPDLEPARVLGQAERSINRNFLRSAWWRAEVLGADSNDPPAAFLEDNLVHIMEVTGLFGNKKITSAIVDIWSEEKKSIDQGEHENHFREFVKRFRRKAAFISFEGLTDNELKIYVRKELRENA